MAIDDHACEKVVFRFFELDSGEIMTVGSDVFTGGMDLAFSSSVFCKFLNDPTWQAGTYNLAYNLIFKLFN